MLIRRVSREKMGQILGLKYLFPGVVVKSIGFLVCMLVIQIAIGLIVNRAAGPLWSVAMTADTGDKKYANTKTNRRYATGPECGRILEQIQLELKAKRWSRAIGQLHSSLNTTCISSYEKSQVWNLLAYTHYARNSIDDALNAYKNVMAEPQTDERLKIDVQYSMAQLYFATERYEEAVRYLESWMHQSSVVAVDSKALLAHAYYRANRKNDALHVVGEVIVDWQSNGKVPKENWWRLQGIIYYEKKQYWQVVATLKNLVIHYPKYNYWLELGGVYGELNQDLHRLVATELVYLAGKLGKERELLSLAYLYVGADAPLLAARMVEKGLKEGVIAKTGRNMEFLGHAWRQAREGEKARLALEQAAELSDQSEVWAGLAKVYLDIGDNEKALRASRNALDKGGLKRSDLTYMVLGKAQINLRCYKAAGRTFERATRDIRSAKSASRWMEYASREGRRDRVGETDEGAPVCSET